MDYHGLLWAIMDYHVLPWTIIDYHGLWTRDYNDNGQLDKQTDIARS